MAHTLRMAALAAVSASALAFSFAPTFPAKFASAPSPTGPTPASSSTLASAPSTKGPNPASCLPLLPPGTLFGAQYSRPPNGTTGNATDALFSTFVTSTGARLAQIGLPWADIETTPGVVNYELVAEILQGARAAGLVPLVNIAAIDTNHASVPSDLVDPADNTRLRPGLNWTSPLLLDRYFAVVSVLAPLAAYYGSPYFGVGNEVSVNLKQHPETAVDFAGFVYAFRSAIQGLTSPDMAVGVTLTVGDLASFGGSPPTWLTYLLDASDVTPLTYYPLNPDFTVVTSPSNVEGNLSAALALLPDGACVVFQELGCPSGFNNASSVDGSSEEVQAAFFDTALSFIATANASSHPVRAVSIYQFVDMEPNDCVGLAHYYVNGTAPPGFLEYLCTLGVVSGDDGGAEGYGRPKKAYKTLLSALTPHADAAADDQRDALGRA
jgi:hypothetical protein